MDQSQVKKEFYEITTKRLRDEGWESITQFARRSGIGYSVETVRRAFTSVEDKEIGPDTLALVLLKLNYTIPEVKELLETYTDISEKHKYLWPRLGDNNHLLSIDEEVILGAYRKIVTAKPELRSQFADHLTLLAMLAGVDVSVETKQLHRKLKG